MNKLAEIVLNIPWLQILAESWKLGRKLWRGMAVEGMYEVLEYESTLDIRDKYGKQAQFQKREKVRYLQDNIIAFQDHAWGDGKILLDYACTPGFVADRYRPNYKTFILISLREMKRREDVDEFNIKWGIEKGFTRSREQWETQVIHRTKRLKIQVLFPKSRPPLRVQLVEKLVKRVTILSQNNIVRLPNGRWQVSWQTDQPRLNESYILKWEW